MKNFHANQRKLVHGFTLIELLVVITIVILVSAVALAVVPGLAGNYQVTEGARIVQAALAGARDAAIRANAPRGIRLTPDPTLSDVIGSPKGRLIVNRLIPIEPAPDLNEGLLTFPPRKLGGLISWNWNNTNGYNGYGMPPTYPIPEPSYLTKAPYNVPNSYPYFPPGAPFPNQVLMVMQSVYRDNNISLIQNGLSHGPIPNPPTNWFWNVRIGDKLRFNDSGQYYTIVGPMTVPNPEYFVNIGQPGVDSTTNSEALVVKYVDSNPANSSNKATVYPEFLFLVNGKDDNNNGFVDEGFNNVDENLDGTPDDIGEWYGYADNSINYSLTPPGAEQEAWLGDQINRSTDFLPLESKYTIVRRPVPSPGAREILLPSSVVIDLTTWNTTRERSRLPDPDSNGGVIDILLNSSGQVIPTTLYSTPAASRLDTTSFFHFWIADRSDVYLPDYPQGGPVYPELPMPESTPGYPPSNNPNLVPGVFLKKDRHLVTLFTRSGQIVTNSINNFQLLDPTTSAINPDPQRPFFEAQQGIREAK